MRERAGQVVCMASQQLPLNQKKVGSTTRKMPCQVSIIPTFQSKALYAQQISPHRFQGPGLCIAWDNAGTSSLPRKIANDVQVLAGHVQLCPSPVKDIGIPS